MAIFLIIFVTGGSYAGNSDNTQQQLIDRISLKLAGKPNAAARIKFLNNFMPGSTAAGKAQAIGQRIIGLRTNIDTSGVWQLSDSSSYTYVGDKGSPQPLNREYSTKLNYKPVGSAVENEFRYTRTIDANNNRETVLTERWNGSAWENSRLDVIGYDNYGFMNLLLGQLWDGSGWENYTRDTFVNRPSGDSELQIFQNWNGSSWENDSRFTAYFTPAGLLDSLSSEFWTNGIFDVVYENKYIYNASGKLIERFQKYNGDYDDTWTQYTYDANGNEISSLIQQWDGSTWNDWIRYTTTYNAANYPTLSMSEIMDNGVWVPNIRYVTAYNANNYISELSTEEWDGAMWEGYSKEIRTYDANNNPDVYIHQTWDMGGWVNSTRTDYDYNLDFNNLDYSLKQDWVAGSWENSGEEYRYYETHQLSGIATVSNGSIKLYPNPASSMLTLDLYAPTVGQQTEIAVFNISGQQLLSTSTTGERVTLNIDTLAKGMYILKVTQGSQISHTRFVKE